jgi:hypothetical protein
MQWPMDNGRSTSWTTLTWTGTATGSLITVFLDTYDGAAYWDTATPGPVTINNSAFPSNEDGWAIVVWKSGSNADGTMIWQSSNGNPTGNMYSQGTGITNNSAQSELKIPYSYINYGTDAAPKGNYRTGNSSNLLMGSMAVTLLPAVLLMNVAIFFVMRSMFHAHGLKIRRNVGGLVVYIFGYSLLLQPARAAGFLAGLMRPRSKKA